MIANGGNILGPASNDGTLVSVGMHVRLPLVSRARGRITEPSSAYIALVRFSAGAVR